MKKLIAILAALMLLISGCGDSGSDGSNSKDSGKKKEKEVVQLNDAEELPYISTYEERGEKTAFNRIDAVEVSDITSELSFRIQNRDNLPVSEMNVLEDEYVAFVVTFNGQRFMKDEKNSDLNLQNFMRGFGEDFKFVKGEEVLSIPYVDWFFVRTPDIIGTEVDEMYVYSQTERTYIIKREYLEDENIQIRLPENDKWIYFDIER